MAGNQMIRYDAACRALAEAKAVDEVKSWADKAAAMQAYGRMAKDKTLEVDAAEIRIRAERRLGELLAEQKAGPGLNRGAAGAPGPGRGNKNAVPARNRVLPPTLAEAGIDKKLSARAQKLAAVPAAEFEAEVGEWRERVQGENARVTTRLEAAGERAIAKDAKPAKPAKGPTLESLQTENAALRAELEELREANREMTDIAESYGSMEAGEHAMVKEMAKLRGLMRTVETQRDQWMTTANEAKRQVKSLQRQLAAMERKAAA